MKKVRAGLTMAFVLMAALCCCGLLEATEGQDLKNPANLVGKKWVGAWPAWQGLVTYTMLVVDKVDSGKVSGVYSWKTEKRDDDFKSSKFVSDGIKTTPEGLPRFAFKGGAGTFFTFDLQTDGRMKIMRLQGSISTEAILQPDDGIEAVNQ
jgi:hypothetical protein